MTPPCWTSVPWPRNKIPVSDWLADVSQNSTTGGHLSHISSQQNYCSKYCFNVCSFVCIYKHLDRPLLAGCGKFFMLIVLISHLILRKESWALLAIGWGSPNRGSAAPSRLHRQLSLNDVQSTGARWQRSSNGRMWKKCIMWMVWRKTRVLIDPDIVLSV